MEEIVRDINKIIREADNAFSYCAMNFDKRMDTINEWNRLLCPENVEILLNHIEEQQRKIDELEAEEVA